MRRLSGDPIPINVCHDHRCVKQTVKKLFDRKKPRGVRCDDRQRFARQTPQLRRQQNANFTDRCTIKAHGSRVAIGRISSFEIEREVFLKLRVFAILFAWVEIQWALGAQDISAVYYRT